MKARITGEIVKSQKVKKIIVNKIKSEDPMCAACSDKFDFCEGGCKSFWERNENKLLSRKERRKK